MIILTLAARNVLRNLRRLLPMIITLVLVFALLIMGNAILGSIVESLYRVYALNVTGDLTIGPASKEKFTVFGSDQLLVGNYLIPPTLVDTENLKEKIESWPETRVCTGLVSSAARVEIGIQKKNATVFGVDFLTYPDVVKGLQLDAGSFPESGETGIVIQAQGWQDPEKLIGQKVLLTSGLG